MPHFRVEDGFHSHPKTYEAGDDAIGLWTRAGSFCMNHLTDGFVPEWWVRQQPRGMAKAKRLIAAVLWRPAQRDGKPGFEFHEWRQDSRAKIEADREKARRRKEAERQRRSPQESQRDRPRDSQRESAKSPGYIPNTHTQKNSGYVDCASPEPNANDPRSAPVTPTGNRLVTQTIPDEHPAAIRTELRLQASALLKAGQPEDLVADALRLWTTKNVHPKTLPALVSELINTRNRPAINGHSVTKIATSDAAFNAAQALKNTHPGTRLELEK